MNARQTPSIFIQNENLNVPIGKGADVINPSERKKNKGVVKDRKALAHISGVPKPLASQSTVTKNHKETINKKQPVKRDTLLSEDDIQKCHEWAREGIESCPFTLNDAHRLEENALDLRVKNEVDLVMGSMKSWSDICFNELFDLPRSSSEAPKDIDDIIKLELVREPEITSPRTNHVYFSDDEDIDALVNTDDDCLFNNNDDDNFVLMESPTSIAG